VRGATWEFTPRDGITHIRNCDWCAKYKEHLTIAEAMKNITRDPTYESAWSIRDQYEQKLIRLGWDLAHEGGRLSEPEINAVKALEQRNHQLQIQVDGWCHSNRCAAKERNELVEALECERLDASLRGGEADFWKSQYEYIQKEYSKLERKLIGIQPSNSPPPKDEDVQMGSTTPKCSSTEPSGRDCPNTLLTSNVGSPPRKKLKTMRHPDGPESSSPVHVSSDAVACIAVVRDDSNTVREHEFRAAQCRNYENGEHPRTFRSDCCCMAALVKVNGLEAYVLLDSGSTTVSITHYKGV
jgi:hypothetical protein